MLRITLVGLLLVVIATGGFAQEKNDEKKPLALLPLAKGTKWEYEATLDNMKVDAVWEVSEVAASEKGKPAVAGISISVGSMAGTKESFSADENGVYQHTMGGKKLETPTVAIQYPVKTGKRWSHKIDLDGTEGTLDFEQLEPVELKVPAGKYTAYPVKVALKSGGKTLVTNIFWYADGVGIVKHEIDLGTAKVTQELKKYTPAK